MNRAPHRGQLTAKNLALAFGDVATGLYEAEGIIQPQLALLDHNGHGILFTPSPSFETITLAWGAIAAAAAGTVRARFLVAVAEAWSKGLGGEAALRTMAEGAPLLTTSLETLHNAGDNTVKTAATVVSLDVIQRRQSAVFHSVALTEPPTVTWEESVTVGWPPGRVSKALMEGYESSGDTGASYEQLIGALKSIGIVAGGLLIEPG